MKHLIKRISLIVLACVTQGLLLYASEQPPLTFHLHIDQSGNINVPHANNASLSSFGGWLGWLCSGALQQAGYASIPLCLLVSGYALFQNDYFQKYATIRFTLKKKDDFIDWTKSFFGKDKKSIKKHKKRIKEEEYRQGLADKDIQIRVLTQQITIMASQYEQLQKQYNHMHHQPHSSILPTPITTNPPSKRIIFIHC